MRHAPGGPARADGSPPLAAGGRRNGWEAGAGSDLCAAPEAARQARTRLHVGPPTAVCLPATRRLMQAANGTAPARHGCKPPPPPAARSRPHTVGRAAAGRAARPPPAWAGRQLTVVRYKSSAAHADRRGGPPSRGHGGKSKRKGAPAVGTADCFTGPGGPASCRRLVDLWWAAVSERVGTREAGK